MAEFHHLGQEVVLQSELLRHKAVLIPGITVGGDAERLDDIGTHRLVPRDVGRRVGSGPRTGCGKRLGRTFASGCRPVEIKAVGLDVFDLLRLGRSARSYHVPDLFEGLDVDVTEFSLIVRAGVDREDVAVLQRALVVPVELVTIDFRGGRTSGVHDRHHQEGCG